MNNPVFAGLASAALAAAFAAAQDPGLLSAHPVSRRVNSPRTDDPGLTEPIMAGE